MRGAEHVDEEVEAERVIGNLHKESEMDEMEGRRRAS